MEESQIDDSFPILNICKKATTKLCNKWPQNDAMLLFKGNWANKASSLCVA